MRRTHIQAPVVHLGLALKSCKEDVLIALAEAEELRSLVSEKDDQLREAQTAYDELKDDMNDVKGRMREQTEIILMLQRQSMPQPVSENRLWLPCESNCYWHRKGYRSQTKRLRMSVQRQECRPSGTTMR